MERDRILGIPYDNISLSDAVDRVDGFIRDDKSHTVVILSTISLMTSRKEKYLRIFFEEADLIIPSGKYIHWAARFLNKPLKELIEPSVFIKILLNQSVELNKSVYLFGGKGNTINRTYYNLKKDIPKLFVVGKYRGNYKLFEHENIVKSIGKASPNYFFIGLGSPHEEIWVNQNRNRINSKVVICVEDIFNLFAGVKKIGFIKEWNKNRVLKREIPHPKGFKKLWLLPLFIVSVWVERLFFRK